MLGTFYQCDKILLQKWLTGKCQRDVPSMFRRRKSRVNRERGRDVTGAFTLGRFWVLSGRL
jgi:hypothetical protein